MRSWKVTDVTQPCASTTDPGLIAPQTAIRSKTPTTSATASASLVSVLTKAVQMDGVTVRRWSYGPGGPTGTSCGTEAFPDPELL